MIGGYYILSRQTYQILYEVVSWLSLTKFPENLKKVNDALSNGSSGIIVLKWNLIKHEKLKHVQFIDDICDTSEEVNGFSPYPEFFCKTIASEEYMSILFSDFFTYWRHIFWWWSSKYCHWWSSGQRIAWTFSLVPWIEKISCFKYFTKQELLQRTYCSLIKFRN